MTKSGPQNMKARSSLLCSRSFNFKLICFGLWQWLQVRLWILIIWNLH